MNNIFDRIMQGEAVCPSEINMHNAAEIIGWVTDTDRHHTKDECRNGKDCVHAPGAMSVDWAATITSEAGFICVCGDHGVNDPAEAARVLGEFRTKWNKDNVRPPRVKR